MATILVRYCEIGLYSTPVRRRFESMLKDNMLTMLASDGVEALVEQGDARYFIETDDEDGCVAALKKVFGIASISVTVTCTSDLEDICRTAAEFSMGRIEPGMTFAVRARREGTHPYTSMDVGREAGSAIYLAHDNLKVDLHTPEKTFYVEIRNNKTYIFDSYIECPGGLPMGCQGRVAALIDSERAALSAWMMMKRGCRVIAAGDGDMTLLRMYDPTLRVVDMGDSARDVLGRVYGYGMDGLDRVDWDQETPAFLPTVAMTEEETAEMYGRVLRSEF